MAFKITARTILHLGADLISSDAVALYELIKNSIDAKSKTGVSVDFEIVLRHGDFVALQSAMESFLSPENEPSLRDLDASDLDEALVTFKRNIRSKIINDSPLALREVFEAAIDSAKTVENLKTSLESAYSTLNRIVVADTGDGMSYSDLEEVYLTIGTTSRANAVNHAIEMGEEKSPYLGEKGVGRLSVMRLGWKVRIETAKAEDELTNVLEIDWHKFEEAYDKEASSIELSPTLGEPKKVGESFTRIYITGLRSTWNKERLNEIAKMQIARMTDPFSWGELKRFPISLRFNDQSIDQVRTVGAELLKRAHSRCIGKYVLVEGRQPTLTARFETSLYDSSEVEQVFDLTDLLGMSGIHDNGLPTSTLRRVGDFSFELYWFNRQRLRGYPDIGDLNTVRELVRKWAGVSLFRDGYRVLPYGDEGDDWLGLDLDALSSTGYKLNTKQIIGRVSIGRTRNPFLVDQTNRQGLTDTPEKFILVRLLRNLISHRWRNYLNDAMKASTSKDVIEYDSPAESSKVETLQERTNSSLAAIRKDFSGDAKLLREVRDAFAEIKDAHNRAVARIETIEGQKDRLTQLAGVGLLVETIAHELTRATELTQTTLKNLKYKNIDSETTAAFTVLGQQIKVIQKRLQTLEPLSITARQRRSKIRISRIVDYVLEAHVAQFERHRISALHRPDSATLVDAFVIEGHVVQIIENLISNSIYWLDLHGREHPAFKPVIEVWIAASPPCIFYRDNGPGIPASRAEVVFEPFFSTKSGSDSRRQGLGLYIARQTAEMLGGTLTLTNLDEPRVGRYNTFRVELKEGA